MYKYLLPLILSQFTGSGNLNDWRNIQTGTYDHYHNFTVENPADPGYYNGEYGGGMSADHCVYYTVKFPQSAYYRVRVVMEGATGNLALGCQVAVWSPEDFNGVPSWYTSNSPTYTSGAGPNYLSTEVYMWIEQGVGSICVDGYGATQGKFYLHVDRACTPDGELFMLPNPPQNPFDVEQQVIIL